MKRFDDGKLGFARVEVDVERSARTTVEVRLSSTDEYPPAPEWVEASRFGAEATMDVLRSRQFVVTGRHVVVTRIVGSISDTTPDAVACAAGLAVCRALVPNQEMPLVSPGPHHRLVYPASWTATIQMAG